MGKIDPNFAFDMFRFIHKPIRTEDAKNDNFLERYMSGMQVVWEDINAKIFTIQDITNPSTVRSELLQYLKNIVGFTPELEYITNNLSDNDLRKVILLAVPLWKTKGTELGFRTIIRLFTGSDARVFNWFDYRMIVGEKAIGEEQLGEDAWLISEPNVQNINPVGDPLLILQFDDKTVKDGSAYQNNLTSHGSFIFEEGGATSQSSYYPSGTGWCIRAPYRQEFTYESGITFECYFKTKNPIQLVPLLYNWDDVNGKGIKIYIDTITDMVIFTISDGFITDSASWPMGIVSSDYSWHHIAFAIDWKADNYFEDGLCSIWIDGVKVNTLTINNSISPAEVRSIEALLIGAEDEYGTLYEGALDSIRLTKDIMYDVEADTITPPIIKFIEYQREELDEFQIDIRIVDEGSLDRLQLKRIVNLMRPVGERVNICYIDFYDEFRTGKGRFITQSGNAYVEEFENVHYMKLPSDSLEHVNVTNSSGWKNYIAQVRGNIYSGSAIEIRWLVQDADNYYAFNVNSDTKLGTLIVCVGGVRTQLASPVPVDVSSANPDLYYSFYIFTVSCFTDENNGNTAIRAFIDSNLIFEVVDTTFDHGTLGIYAPVGSECWCSEVELFQLPLQVERINPNDKFQ